LVHIQKMCIFINESVQEDGIDFLNEEKILPPLKLLLGLSPERLKKLPHILGIYFLDALFALWYIRFAPR